MTEDDERPQWRILEELDEARAREQELLELIEDLEQKNTALREERDVLMEDINRKENNDE